MRQVWWTTFVLIAACGPMGSRHPYIARAPGAPMARVDVRTNGNTSKDYGVNPWVDTATDNLSTFGADVDTASYTLARKTLRGGELPPAASIRVEGCGSSSITVRRTIVVKSGRNSPLSTFSFNRRPV